MTAFLAVANLLNDLCRTTSRQAWISSIRIANRVLIHLSVCPKCAFIASGVLWAPPTEKPRLWLRPGLETSFLGARASVRRAAYTCDIVENGSASRTMGRNASERACYCDSCGICFVYLATKCLKFKAKDLILVPDLLALALQADGWFLRSEIVWSKPPPMPESVTGDRPTCAHEKVWLLTKSERYFYDAASILEPMSEESAARYKYGFGGDKNKTLKAGDKPTAVVGDRIAEEGRNARNVWTIASEPYRGAHYAVMPSTLAERCIKAGSPERVCSALRPPRGRV